MCERGPICWHEEPLGFRGLGVKGFGEVLFGSYGFTALGPWVQGSGLDFQAHALAVGGVAKFRT